MSLYIRLPLIDEDWMEHNLTEILTSGTDILHSTEPKAMAFNLNCSAFEEAFKNLQPDDFEYFYSFSNQAEKAEEETVQCLKILFEDYNLWGQLIDTVEKIGQYNECIAEIGFMCAERYGEAWIDFLDLTYDDNASD